MPRFVLLNGRLINLDHVREVAWAEADAPVGLRVVAERPKVLRVRFGPHHDDKVDVPKGTEAENLWAYLAGIDSVAMNVPTLGERP